MYEPGKLLTSIYCSRSITFSSQGQVKPAKVSEKTEHRTCPGFSLSTPSKRKYHSTAVQTASYRITVHKDSLGSSPVLMCLKSDILGCAPVSYSWSFLLASFIAAFSLPAFRNLHLSLSTAPALSFLGFVLIPSYTKLFYFLLPLALTQISDEVKHSHLISNYKHLQVILSSSPALLRQPISRKLALCKTWSQLHWILQLVLLQEVH